MKTLINIFGCGRSGTTMLDLMLGNDANTFSLGEVYAWFRPHRKHHFEIICSCASKERCKYWMNIKNLKEDVFHFESFNLLKVDFLIDSSKNLNWGIDNNLWALDNHIKVFNILIYKDPINYIYSMWKRGCDVDETIKGYVNYHRRFLQTNIPFFSVKFEDLVNDTDNNLQRLSNIVGLKFFKNKKDFWLKDHHHIFGSMGTRKQVEMGSSYIRLKEDFPEEFIQLIPEIKKKINNNKELIKLLDHLNSKKDNTLSQFIIRKPFWYYLYKLKEIYTRIFPSAWKYNQ